MAGQTMRKMFPFLLLLAGPLHAERLFVSILETDSATHARYNATAFSRSAESPSALETVEESLRKNLVIPYSTWLAENKPIRFIMTVDSLQSISPENPATLAIVPMVDNGERALAACSAVYTRKTPMETYGTLFERPSSTNYPARLALAKEGSSLLVSPSPDALAWGWKFRDRFIHAPAQTLPGTFRMLVNAQRFSDLLPLLHPDIDSYPFVKPFLRNFATAVLSFTLSNEAFGFAIRGMPQKDSALAAQAAAWDVPPAAFWRYLPEEALFSSLTHSRPPTFVNGYVPPPYSFLVAPFRSLVPPGDFKGPSFSILMPTSDRKGISLATFSQLEKQDAAVGALAKLTASQKNDDPVEWTRLPARKSGSVDVERYSVAFRKGSGKKAAGETDGSLVQTVVSMFLQKARLEATVKNGFLVTVLGPDENLVESAMSLLEDSGMPQMQTMEKILVVNDPCLASGKLTFAASLQISRLLLQAVSIIPDVRQEQIAQLPSGGDGATFGIVKEDDGAVTLSCRVMSSEIAAIQKINSDARPMLQEIFFQMFARQMQMMKEKDAGTQK